MIFGIKIIPSLTILGLIAGVILLAKYRRKRMDGLDPDLLIGKYGVVAGHGEKSEEG